MCLTVGIEHRGMALVATDTRTTFVRPDGSYTRQDLGGKLVRLPDGWVTGSGSLAVYLNAIDRMEASGLADMDRVRADLAEARAAVRVAPQVGEALGDTRFAIVVDSGPRPTIHEIRTGGEAARGGLGWCFVQLPPEVGDAERNALTARFGESVDRCRTVMDTVRVTAGLFAQVAPAAESISGDVQIGLSWPAEGGGVQARWIEGSAAELATASSESVLLRLQPPATLPRVEWPVEEAGTPCA